MDIVPQLVVNSLIAGSLYALVAMSFNLIYGVSRSFNLAHGALGAIAAYAVFLLASGYALPLAAAIPIAIGIAALAALALERFVFAPLREHNASNYVLLIASLGALSAIEGTLAILFSSQFKTIGDLLSSEPIFQFLNTSFSAVQLVMLVAALLTLFSFWFFLSYTKFGRAVRAIADDEEVAKIVGINTARIIGWVFVIGGAVMGIAGVLAGFDTGLTPQMGFLLILDGAIAAIVGGIGNVYGAFLGAYLLGFAENFGVWFVSGEWKYAIAFSVLIVFLLFRPEGFLGKK